MSENTTIKLIDTETTEETAHLVEREDEKAILEEEMTGELLQALVYIGKDGRPVLSYAGIKEGARRFKNIKYGVSRIEETPDFYIAYGYAINLADNISIEIPKRQLKLMSLKDGSKIPDEFAFEKACAKAIRNAIKGVIPIQYFQALIQKFLEQEKNQTKTNGEKYSNTDVDKFQKHEATIKKMRNGVHLILAKTGIDKDEDIKERVCNTLIGKPHISDWTDEELKKFYEEITKVLHKEKLSLRELTEEDYNIIKEFLLDKLVRAEANPQKTLLYKEGVE